MRHHRVDGPPPFFFEVDFHVLSVSFFLLSFTLSRLSACRILFLSFRLCRPPRASWAHTLMPFGRPPSTVDRCRRERSMFIPPPFLFSCIAFFSAAMDSCLRSIFPFVSLHFRRLCLVPLPPTHRPMPLGRHHAKSLLGAQIHLNSIAFN